MDRHVEFERLFRETNDNLSRLITLSQLPGSRPLFYSMDCRIVARDLRELADRIEGFANEEPRVLEAAE